MRQRALRVRVRPLRLRACARLRILAAAVLVERRVRVRPLLRHVLGPRRVALALQPLLAALVQRRVRVRARRLHGRARLLQEPLVQHRVRLELAEQHVQAPPARERHAAQRAERLQPQAVGDHLVALHDGHRVAAVQRRLEAAPHDVVALGVAEDCHEVRVGRRAAELPRERGARDARPDDEDRAPPRRGDRLEPGRRVALRRREQARALGGVAAAQAQQLRVHVEALAAAGHVLDEAVAVEEAVARLHDVAPVA
mmetsp:Transcript_4980/g.14749  ORF Transcript_4980/g.14749 Transcript_4980/m.14749 type:complete len:255 (+) Transcript_4980:626-1390(+)